MSFFQTVFMILVGFGPSWIIAVSVRTFNIESFNSCTKGQYLAQMKELSIQNDRGKLIVYGEMYLNETIKGAIEFTIEANLCNMERTKCNPFPPVTKDFCANLNSDFFEPDFFPRLTPNLKCPIQAGFYVMNNSVVDFSTLAKVSFETGRHFVKVSVNQKVGFKKRPIVCWNIKSRVTVSSSKKT